MLSEQACSDSCAGKRLTLQMSAAGILCAGNLSNSCHGRHPKVLFRCVALACYGLHQIMSLILYLYVVEKSWFGFDVVLLVYLVEALVDPVAQMCPWNV